MNDSACFLINEFENKLVVSHAESEGCNKQDNSSIRVTSDPTCGEFKVETKENVALESVFDEFYEQLSSIKLNEKQMDRILVLSENLVTNYSKVLCDSLKDECGSFVSDKAKFLCKKINERNSKVKRLKEQRKNPLFVEAERHSIGLRWRSKLDSKNEIPNHFLAQSNFHYSSIKGTLQSLFKRSEFKDTHLKYNLHEKHTCTEGIYQDYCCGNNAKKSELLRDPKTLQIELGIDDFEVCSGLKTKTVTHNVTGVYFRVRNLPAKVNSRLDNIHLVALCKVQDLKQCGESFDNIATKIVTEIRELQINGIEIDNVLEIKGTLVNICADNLGANGLFGLVKSFNTDGFCRICECTKRESEIQIRESPVIMRKKDDYMEYVEIANMEDRRDTKKSKGIVQYCVFNDLDHFHIFDNYSIDIMHIIPVFLKFFYETLVDRKILKFNDIVRMVRDHNYGILSQRNKPSKVTFTKRNLNQNATQSYNLLLNLPFIFFGQKDRIEDIWSILETLLKSLQIIFSSKITENDLKRLTYLIPRFLSGLIDHDLYLTSKLHNMTHYVTVIRNMGPLIHMWAMRMESKHKYFTQIANNTTCFKNITETLAARHQQNACLKTNMFSDKIIPSKRRINLQQTQNFEKYSESNIFDNSFDKSVSLDFLKINSFEYRKNFMVLCENAVYEIGEILSVENRFFLLCFSCKVNEFNEQLNSIDVSKCDLNDYNLIELTSQLPKPYEKIFLKNKSFIIADTLMVYNNFLSNL